MSDYEKAEKLDEGKTKIIWVAQGYDDVVIVENKSYITALDDPKFTKQFEKKAIYATTTTCRVFELLKKTDIPVAYTEQFSPTEFVASKCKMIPLEVVARRYAVGSYLKRHPELERPKSEPPFRFHRLVTEFFLKTTKGQLEASRLNTASRKVVVDGLHPEAGEEDPLIVNPQVVLWTLVHSKKPSWDPAAKLREGIDAETVIGDKSIREMDELVRSVFLILEGMWATFGCRLIDIKIEFGVTEYGKLVVADVIDSDSWRLRDARWKELSKEVFRQGGAEALGEVEKNYGLVAEFVSSFRLPKQCLVLWRGSDKDEFPQCPADLHSSDIDIREVTASGHKSPQKCTRILEEFLAGYPDGGVIVVKVGRSNGLGPMLAARTCWPVISIPATMKEFPEDVWSSIRMPGQVPMGTTWPENEAVQFALNILSKKSPPLYHRLQKEIEKLDD